MTRPPASAASGIHRIRAEDHHLSGRDALAFLIGCASIGIIAFLDHQTGPELAFSIFYIPPIAWVAWYGGIYSAIALSVLGGAAWLYVDYVQVPVSHDAVHIWNAGVRLITFLIVGVALARLRDAYRRLRDAAYTDSLTGAPNSRAFYTRVEMELARARRSPRTLTLVFLDLDNFKTVNDRMGHRVGDEVLLQTVRSLRSHLRAGDAFARMGGDEFAALLVHASPAELPGVLDRLHRDLVSDLSARGWPVTPSIGAVTFPAPPDNVEVMVQQADERMYQGKSMGKNRVVHHVEHATTPAASPTQDRE